MPRSLLAFVVVAVSSCGPGVQVFGSGQVGTTTRAVEGTVRVDLAMPGALIVELGERASLRIDAEENLLEHLTSAVSAGELHLGQRGDVNLHPTRPINYVLTVPSLEGVTTSSSGGVWAPALTASTFTARIRSSGHITLDGLQASRLDVAISSSGDLQIGPGVAREQHVSISSSGSYSAPKLKSDVADVDISSSGDALIWVTDRLDVTISSSGHVRYYGDPRVTAHITSSGSVTRIGDG